MNSRRKTKEGRVATYMLFCEKCGNPQPIKEYIIKTYFVTEVPGVYCRTCDHLNPIPDYLRKIADEL